MLSISLFLRKADKAIEEAAKPFYDAVENSGGEGDE